MVGEGIALPRFDKTLFAVVDLETTGWSAAQDRIVEVAIVRFSGDGSSFYDEWSTLVNPSRRGTGRLDVHRVERRDVMRAPRFPDIAGDLVARLSGCVLAAHNVAFDLGFLEAEFRRTGEELPRKIPQICTLKLGERFGVRSRRLAQACAQFGIALEEGHSALADAKACAWLLAAYLAMVQQGGVFTLEGVGVNDEHPPREAWPTLPARGLTYTRDQAQAEQELEEAGFITSLVDRLPAAGVPQEAEYLDLLDRVMADRRVTAQEASSLFSVAVDWGLSRERVHEIHRSYLRSVVIAALEDHVITTAEQNDIGAVARLLGFDMRDALEIIDEERSLAQFPRPGKASAPPVATPTVPAPGPRSTDQPKPSLKDVLLDSLSDDATEDDW
ncbi:MAG TPA: hypothetical protein DEA08_13495 [Planctomycetes bacterium]|nr:hypothetical protein [Planctomycetota bacterium]